VVSVARETLSVDAIQRKLHELTTTVNNPVRAVVRTAELAADAVDILLSAGALGRLRDPGTTFVLTSRLTARALPAAEHIRSKVASPAT
jgi:hypothetical protein